jgi:sugar-specific transcriptional regulator TrmB
MIDQELQKIGLSPKEIKVYVSALQTGPKSAQDIARHAGVNRVTCYVVLENLMRYGLITHCEGEKGRIFTAENPERLKNYIEAKKNEINEKGKNVDRVMPHLMALFNEIGDKPHVHYLEGDQGIKLFKQRVLSSSTKQIDEIVSVDAVYNEWGNMEHYDYKEKIFQRDTKYRIIYTIKKYTLDYLPSIEDARLEARQLPYDKFVFPGNIDILDDFAAIACFQKKPSIIILEHPDIIAMLRSWFDLAWESAEEHKAKLK